jgi:predicted ATP-dependent endonuclease of OLD family
MFNKFVNALKTFFSAKPVSLQFEEMLLQEAVQEIKDAEAVKEKVVAVEAKATVAKVKTVAKKAAPKVAKAKTADKAPAKKPKKPNIKLVK